MPCTPTGASTGGDDVGVDKQFSGQFGRWSCPLGAVCVSLTKGIHHLYPGLLHCRLTADLRGFHQCQEWPELARI